MSFSLKFFFLRTSNLFPQNTRTLERGGVVVALLLRVLDGLDRSEPSFEVSPSQRCGRVLDRETRDGSPQVCDCCLLVTLRSASLIELNTLVALLRNLLTLVRS